MKIKTFSRLTWFGLGIPLLQLFLSVKQPQAADTDAERQKIMEKLGKLRDKKQGMLRKQEEKLGQIDRKVGENRAQSIALFEKIIQSREKNPRIADALFQLGELYLEESNERFSHAMEEYERAEKLYEKKKIANPPASPMRDYSKSIKVMKRLVSEYPQFPNRDNALYRLASILSLVGLIDDAFVYFNDIVLNYPYSPNQPVAHLRVGEYYFFNRDVHQALEHYQKTISFYERQGNISQNWTNYSLALFRIAHCYYRVSSYQQAIEKFFEYIENCESGIFQKCDFLEESIEYIAICYADQAGGTQQARRFLESKGGKKFDAKIYFLIGSKNRKNNQLEEALAAFQYLMERYPYYTEAPTAQMMVIECLHLQKKYDEANQAREVLVDQYSRNSKWAQMNSNSPQLLAKADKAAEEALAFLPLYYHELAQKTKNKEYLRKAIPRYHEFLRKFSNSRLKSYEYNYYLAEALYELEDLLNAGKQYMVVVEADTTGFGVLLKQAEKESREESEKGDKKKGGGAKIAVINKERACYNAITCFEKAREAAVKERSISDEIAFSHKETEALVIALQKYKQLFPQGPDLVNIMMLEAQLYYNAKQYNLAINAFESIINRFSRHAHAMTSRRMLAQSYTLAGEFKKAEEGLKYLVASILPTDTSYQKVIDQIAAAIYKSAEQLKAQNKSLEAAREFKRVMSEFPKSNIADQALFEAGLIYENQKEYRSAALTYEDLVNRYPQSKYKIDALAMAADNFKKLFDYKNAARIYLMVVQRFPEEKQVVPALLSAADCYEKVEDWGEAADTYKDIAKKFPRHAVADTVLYNAGLLYEKSKRWEDAIGTYSLLESNYPKSDYAAEASYSIALNYQNRKDIVNMVKAFDHFAAKYSYDKAKVFDALLKSAEAYQDLNRDREYYQKLDEIVEFYRKYGRRENLEVNTAARAQFYIAYRRVPEYNKLKFTGSKKEIDKNIKAKQNLLKEILKDLALTIKYEAEEWTLKATMATAELFENYAETFSDQEIPKMSQDQLIATKYNIQKGLENYYAKAAEYYFNNVELGQKFSVENDLIDLSKNKFTQMLYQHGKIYETVGEIIVRSPIPQDLPKEKQEEYKYKLQDAQIKAEEKAAEIYAAALKQVYELSLDNEWTEKIKSRIQKINPNHAALNLVLKPKAVKVAEAEEPRPTQAAVPEIREERPMVPATTPFQKELERRLDRIRSIAGRNIPERDKVIQLKSMENDARRSMKQVSFEIDGLKKRIREMEGKIRDLKDEIGKKS